MLAVWRSGMRRHSATAALVAIVAPLVASCAGLPSQPTLVAIAILTGASWEVKGKIGCRLEGRAGSVTFNWRQEGDVFSASFSGPLGSARHSMTGDGTTITLRSPDGSLATFGINEPVTWPDLGLSLPPSSLNWWLRGLPNPKSAIIKEVAGFSQHGWTITRPELAKPRPSMSALPTLLKISQPQIFCKIRLSEWQVVGV